MDAVRRPRHISRRRLVVSHHMTDCREQARRPGKAWRLPRAHDPSLPEIWWRPRLAPTAPSVCQRWRSRRRPEALASPTFAVEGGYGEGPKSSSCGASRCRRWSPLGAASGRPVLLVSSGSATEPPTRCCKVQCLGCNSNENLEWYQWRARVLPSVYPDKVDFY
jgi:hypothetical protein